MEELQLRIKPTVTQYEAWQALDNPDIAEIHFGGAAGGGKSWLGAESRLVRAIRYPGYKSFIGRNELKRLLETSYLTFVKVCAYHKIPRSDWRLNGQYNYIEFRNGSRIDLLDLAFKPSDPMYERLGSLEYTDGGWIDEAGEVPFMAVDIVQSRGGRHMNKEFGLSPDSLYTYNPNKGWVYRVHKQFVEGTLAPDVVFIQSLYSDNPFIKDIYGKQLARIKDPAMRARLMLGKFDYDSDPTALISMDAAIDLFTNTLQASDVDKGMTIDVARHGVDKTVIYLWRGSTLYGVRIYQKQGIDVTTQKSKDLAAVEGVAYSRIVPDEDGIGGGVVDGMKGVRGFVANSQPLDNPATKEKENYANLKAQMSYKIAELINDHKIAIKIDPNNFISEVPGVTYEVWKDQLIEELQYIRSKDKDRDVRLRVVSKEDIKAELGRSPDFSDTLMMRALLEYPNKNKSGGNVKIIRPRNYKGFNRAAIRRPGDNTRG